MSSHGSPDVDALDLQLDVPTSPEDVEALRRIRRETPSWFSLSPAELERLLPKGAADGRQTTRPDATPFTLP